MRVKIKRDLGGHYSVYFLRHQRLEGATWRRVAINANNNDTIFRAFTSWCSDFEGEVNIKLEPGIEKVFEVKLGTKPKEVK